MTFKIETKSEGQRTTIRLIGQFNSEHIEELKAEMKGRESLIALDLDEVSLVDVGVVRFLGACEGKGTRVVNCSPYIREWISRERR